jgi:hypothetical protein
VPSSAWLDNTAESTKSTYRIVKRRISPPSLGRQADPPLRVPMVHGQYMVGQRSGGYPIATVDRRHRLIQ